ncbi:hypothetical protein D1BOALGB6SA_7059 [Olavius sp. associated proteobacterium Delta 1]|nr:hypothetical protein D1BOALGB6SA_7059 [Olavius sp. associated proteobacterium Delta 1]
MIPKSRWKVAPLNCCAAFPDRASARSGRDVKRQGGFAIRHEPHRNSGPEKSESRRLGRFDEKTI